MKIITFVLVFLLVACDGFASCKVSGVPGLFSRRLGNEVTVLNLTSDGTGSLTFNHETPHRLTWEFDPQGPQVIVTGETQTLERLRALAHLQLPPPGVASTRQMILAIGCRCNWGGSARQLLVDVEGSFTFTRDR
jgi:hypothetical protein